MQLPPGRSLLDWRCVKDTSPAALVDYMAKWKVVYTSFLCGFAALHMQRCPYRRRDGRRLGWPLPGWPLVPRGAMRCSCCRAAFTFCP